LITERYSFGSWLVSGLQRCSCMALVFACGLACVIPPQMDLESGNTPPQVVFQGTFPPLDPREPHTVLQTATGKPKIVTTFTIRFRDPDPEDVTLRAFLGADYEKFVDEKRVGPVSSGDRSAAIDIVGLCDDLVNNAIGIYDFEVVLSDTGFVDQGADLRETLVLDGRKGSRDHARWRIRCDPAQPSAEGG
jgi:hypothetical protein